MPATVSRAERMPPLFAATVYGTAPSPVPPAAPSVTKASALKEVQAQPAAAVTERLPVVEPNPAVTAPGVTEYVQVDGEAPEATPMPESGTTRFGSSGSSEVSATESPYVVSTVG